jgi:FKBP-type peptidyl-prolyl cis-trans isomerase (trigger factor)
MDQKYERKDIDKSTIEFTITIPSDNFEKSYKAILKDQLKDTEMKGFRKGKLPETAINEPVKQSVRFETFDKLAPFYIQTALTKEEIAPIAPPEFKDLPKLDMGKDVEFTITVTVMPEFKLGNLKKVKVKSDKVKVEDKEVEDALEDLKKSQKTKEKELNDKWAEEIAKLLELKDIKTLKELKDYIKDALSKQKEHMTMHKSQEDALRQGIEISNIEAPEPAVKYETQQREQSFNQEMQQRGVKVEDFIKANNTTIEDMRKLWEQDSKDAIETDIFLTLYAKERGVKVTDEDVNAKIEAVKKTAPEGTDESIYENPEWREYVKRVEQKEKAFSEFTKEVGLEHKHED